MNNDVKGFGISFVLHGAILCSLMSMTTLQPADNMAKVIDFSLVERLGIPQKQLAKNAPTIKAPPTLKPAVKTPIAPMVTKITVPVQEEELIAKQEEKPAPKPLPKEPLIAKNIIEEVADEVQVAPLPETITAAAPTPTAESHDQARDIAEPGLKKELYVEANFHYIKDNIQKKMSYPRLARKMGWQGKVVVSFMVGKDGKVQNVHIIESSGFAALDKNAIATIKKAAPFPCPPVRAELVVPVIYRLA